MSVARGTGSRKNKIVAGISVVVASIALSACSSSDKSPHKGPSASGAVSGVASLKVNSSLHDMLPSSIKSSGTITDGTPLNFPPYISQEAAGQPIVGLIPDMAVAIGKVLGVKITYQDTAFESIFPSMKSGKFDISWGILSDTKVRERTTGADFVDFRFSVQAFVYKTSNPVNGLAAACGKKIGVLSGASVLPKLQAQSRACQSAGKKALDILQYPDQSTAKTQLVGGQIDAYVGDYAENQELVATAAGKGLTVGDSTIPNGVTAMAVPSSQTGLRDALLGALKELKQDGVYDQIINKWKAGGALALDQMVINGATT